MSFDIWNRRYTGSKYKLSDWIVSLINDNCTGNSFCDLFAGTGIMSQRMLPYVNEIHINDFLHSNEIIYQAYFSNGKYSEKKLEEIKDCYRNLNVNDLKDNYISKNFGGKFFSNNDAKIIGYIREDIENNFERLNKKERAILIASLLYSADKVANTVGHYDAYIKGHEIKDAFEYELISPYDTSKIDLHITRKDANELAKQIECDIVYIDPPYNSRQYSRFYHVLENITCWNKPELYGTALKPIPENMSEYCKSSATKTFNDLIQRLKCNYIVVSYNNTYKSKSSSSKNKILLEDLENILKAKGKVKRFEKPYKYFNTGKTDFSNHKEFIYIVRVGKLNEYTNKSKI